MTNSSREDATDDTRESREPRDESQPGCENACPVCYSPATCASRAIDLSALSRPGRGSDQAVAR